MVNKVAIVAVNQLGHEDIVDKSLQEAHYYAVKGLLNQVGIKREELGYIIFSSSDFYQGNGCSHVIALDAGGGYLKGTSKVEEDGAAAFIYGVMRILSGHFDNILIVSITKSSEIPSIAAVSNQNADPFFERPVGLDDINAAAMQARLYMDRYKVTEEQVARVVTKNLGNALNNPYAYRKGRVAVEEVLKSKVVADPIKELDCASPCDAICAVLLASEEEAKKLTDKPAWVKGMGWCVDNSFFGDRDLLNGGLSKAADQAYRMGGIKYPSEEIDVAEICEPYSFQELLWCEQLGFCGEGKGGGLIDSGATAMGGKLPVNPSGGVLAANSYIPRGLIRIAEAALQVMGKAGERQVHDVTTALAHSAHGFAGQLHSVIILGGD